MALQLINYTAGSADTAPAGAAKIDDNFQEIDARYGIVIEPGVSDFLDAFQTANETLLNQGGGYIFLYPAAVYTLKGTILLDCGSGVGLIGNGACIDARSMTSGTAITLGSSAPAQPQVPGFDGASNNYWQTRVQVAGFTLLGQGKSLGTATGIDVNMITELTNRAPRATVRNVAIQGFYKGICQRNQSYLAYFDQVISTNNDNAVYINGGLNPSENSMYHHCVFGNSTYGIVIDTAAETGTAANFDIIFDACSTDYNGVQVEYRTGFGAIVFDKCYFEHNNPSNPYPHHWQDASNTVMVTYDKCRHYYTGPATTGFTNYVYQGNNVQLSFPDNFWNNVLGTGSLIGNTTYVSIVNRAGSNTTLKIDRGRMFNLPSIAPLISTNTDDNWLADGGFEQTNLVDYWWLYRAGGIQVVTGSATARTVGTGVAGIAPTTAAFNSGTQSLAITMDATGTHAAGYRVAALLVPKRGDQFCGSFSHMISAGSGTFTVICYVAKVDPDTSQWTSTNFSTLGYYGFPPTVTKAAQIGPSGGYTITPTVGTWNVSSFSFNNALTDDPRLQIPNWATHLFFQIDFSNINNPSGSVYLDDFFISGF